MTKNDKTAGLNSVDEENAALFKVCPFRCMETPPSFSTIVFKRETIFVTSCLLTRKTKCSQNGVYSSRKKFAPTAPVGANSFF